MRYYQFILIFLITALVSCKVNCNLPDQVIGGGLIDPEAVVNQPLITWEMRDKQHIIQQADENIYDLQVSYDNGLTLEPIDFIKYTLLGIYANDKCNVTFKRTVILNEDQNICEYHVKIHQCGNCKTNWESMNWVLIPKIPEEYVVVFKVD